MAGTRSLVNAIQAWAAVVLTACLLAGCGWVEEGPPIVDGLSVGPALDCGDCDQPNTSDGCGACESIATLARRHLEETWPDHPEIHSLTFHREGWYPGPSGEKVLQTRSGSLVVALAIFVDGSRHAVSVYCGVGGCH